MLVNMGPNKKKLKNEVEKSISSTKKRHTKELFDLENNIKSQISINREYKTTIENQGNKVDSLYVTYVENGFLNPGNIYPDYLSNGKIAFQVAFLTSVVPVRYISSSKSEPFGYKEVELISVFPKSINQKVSKQDMMVHTIDNSFSLGASLGGSESGPNGGLHAGYSHSESFQTWKSKTYSVQDWGVKELSRPYSNKAIWLWHQQNPFDGSRYVNDEAYISKNLSTEKFRNSLPDLSTGTMEYSNSTSWRFNVKVLKANNLNVSFISNVTIYYFVFNTKTKKIKGYIQDIKNICTIDLILSLYNSKLNSIDLGKLLKYGKIG